MTGLSDELLQSNQVVDLAMSLRLFAIPSAATARWRCCRCNRRVALGSMPWRWRAGLAAIDGWRWGLRPSAGNEVQTPSLRGVYACGAGAGRPSKCRGRCIERGRR